MTKLRLTLTLRTATIEDDGSLTPREETDFQMPDVSNFAAAGDAVVEAIDTLTWKLAGLDTHPVVTRMVGYNPDGSIQHSAEGEANVNALLDEKAKEIQAAMQSRIDAFIGGQPKSLDSVIQES